VVFEVTGDTGAQGTRPVVNSRRREICEHRACPHGSVGGSVHKLFLPLHEKSILGSLYGSISTHLDIPKLVALSLKGHLMVEKFTSNKFRVEEINDVAKALERREIMGRRVCQWD
jgi:Zn-dependent alcohol dehydrogenase